MLRKRQSVAEPQGCSRSGISEVLTFLGLLAEVLVVVHRAAERVVEREVRHGLAERVLMSIRIQDGDGAPGTRSHGLAARRQRQNAEQQQPARPAVVRWFFWHRHFAAPACPLSSARTRRPTRKNRPDRRVWRG